MRSKDLNSCNQTDAPMYTVNTSFTAVEGNMFRIDLVLDGNPIPVDFTWSFNGVELLTSSEITFGIDFIEFSSLSTSNAGNYSVTATNTAGSGSGEFSLVIFCKYKLIVKSILINAIKQMLLCTL